jgi:glycosyltransferase involved in cell wall biosynthesis
MCQHASDSAWAQTVKPREVIIIYDEHHRGAAWARNTGLANVSAPYVLFLDDDDALAPQALEMLLAAVEETGADLAYPCTEVLGGRDPLAVAHEGRWVNPCGVPFGEEQERHLRYAGNFIPLGWLADTELVRHVGGFPPAGGPGREEDYQLLINLLNAGARFVHVPERLYRYLIHGANTGGGWEGTGASNRAAFQQ